MEAKMIINAWDTPESKLKKILELDKPGPLLIFPKQYNVRSEAFKELLNEKPNGSWTINESTRQPGMFTITYKSNGKVFQVYCGRAENGWEIITSPKQLFFYRNGCNRILRWKDDGKYKDPATIYLRQKQNGEMAAYWFEKDKFIPHPIQKANQNKLLELIGKSSEIPDSKELFVKIAPLCGYTQNKPIDLDSSTIKKERHNLLEEINKKLNLNGNDLLTPAWNPYLANNSGTCLNVPENDQKKCSDPMKPLQDLVENLKELKEEIMEDEESREVAAVLKKLIPPLSRNELKKQGNETKPFQQGEFCSQINQLINQLKKLLHDCLDMLTRDSLNSLTCPLTIELLTDPYYCEETGLVYDSKALFDNNNQHFKTCPLTHTPIKSTPFHYEDYQSQLIKCLERFLDVMELYQAKQVANQVSKSTMKKDNYYQFFKNDQVTIPSTLQQDSVKDFMLKHFVLLRPFPLNQIIEEAMRRTIEAFTPNSQQQWGPKGEVLESVINAIKDEKIISAIKSTFEERLLSLHIQNQQPPR